jgi:anaerobic dimethyl sulfoxide reductase subunit B (iron-sulfur subunit)
MTIRYGFYLDTRACTGCKACQLACKDKNNLDRGILWRRVIEMEGGDWNKQGNAWVSDLFVYFLSLACMHCEQPICMEVCPTGAITQRKDGIVIINEKVCIGCRYCQWVCPYAALQYDSSKGVMTKCNLCFDLLDQGLAPACVSACQMRVLKFGDIGHLRAKYGSLGDIAPLPDTSLTIPAGIITPHADSVVANSRTLRIANREEI